MNNFKNFTSYTPGEDKRELIDAGVLFLQDENGNDWYECQKQFSENTVKVVYDSNNIIVSISNDVSALWPVGASVAETESLPDGVDINGNWIFDGESIVRRILSPEEWQTKAESQRNILLSEAKERVSIWQSELLLGTISDEDRGSLAAWIEYIKELQQMTFTSVTDEDCYNALVWPESPSKGVLQKA
ncbi:TPA: tail fiber assembly protein [Escherichia coli]|uniref:tail fiber assembly protein n=2 Tax=Escherichia coli TaxID=562 RepID=UPI000BE14955|nr:tail fiber assembly protein [Escherichia coli]EHS0460929.1 tail fiber assembly protein [Escherichia coli]EII4853526.1 tail fiber assembly protein [Escherichia coli]EIQ9233905.1 tail fiber assembly protein [Escherichia coli]EIX4564191.1 tail fiber assembly protein [Escherichia coli]EKP7835513.1 tail fiber assembly protein [Escherichia coli]